MPPVVVLAGVVGAAMLSGCASPSDVGEPRHATPCSDAVKDSAKPQGQPFGILRHTLLNGLGRPATVDVEHLHASGCALGAERLTIAARGEADMTYRDEYWDTDVREFRFEGRLDRFTRIDWACDWQGQVTVGGVVEYRDGAQMCA